MRIPYSLAGMCFTLISIAAAQSPVSGQWSVPRTSEGHPDLQGNWTNVTITPFERREGREPVFTWDEGSSVLNHVVSSEASLGRTTILRTDRLASAALSPLAPALGHQ